MTSFVSIPVELHFDVLQFLSRNEVEKCQLVTHKWDQIIQENGTYFPLRMCEFLHIFNVNDGSRTQVKTYVVIDHENGFSILYENMLNMVEMIKSLKYCIFKEVKIDENYGLQKIQPIKVLQKITKICHQKIKTINYYCERQTEHFLRILETYVSAQKLIFNSYYAESIVQEPKNFIIPMSQKEILMELDVMPRTNNLLKYISRGEFFGGDRVTIHIFWDKVDEEFNEKILEIFKSTKKPHNFIKRVKFSPTAPFCSSKIDPTKPRPFAFRERTREFLQQQLLPCFTEKDEHANPKEIFEYKRSDGFTMKVKIHFDVTFSFERPDNLLIFRF